MKNIFVLPSDKPSRLAYDFDEKCYYLQDNVVFFEHQDLIENRNIYITNSEEINKDTKPCWCINTIKNTWDNDLIYYQGAMPQYHYVGFKKIILTTDPELIKNGVQSIDDDFLEFFVKNPSCEFVEVKEKFIDKQFNSKYVPIIPQPKQETIKEVNILFKQYSNTADEETRRMYGHHLRSFKAGWNRKAKFEQEEKDNFAIGFAEWMDLNATQKSKSLWYSTPLQIPLWEAKTTSELLQIYKSQL